MRPCVVLLQTFARPVFYEYVDRRSFYQHVNEEQSMSIINKSLVWIWDWLRGFNELQLRIGLQVFFAYIIVAAAIFPARVWYALNYGALTPSFAMVIMAFMFPPSVGGGTQKCLFAVGGYILGALLQAIATYAAWGANGGSFTNTVVKFSVFTTLISILAGILNILRWHWSITNLFFLLACVGLVIAGGVTTLPLPFLAWKAPFYVCALVAIGASGILVACWFILPRTAGHLYKSNLAKSYVSMAHAINAIGELLLSPIDPSTGLLLSIEGNIDPTNGMDTGLTSNLQEIRQSLKAAQQELAASRTQQFPVLLELDLYNSPHRFPAAGYLEVKLTAWYAMGTIALIARPLQSGHLRLGIIHEDGIKNRFGKMFHAMEDVLKGMAAVIQGEKKMKELDKLIEEMDSSWINFTDAIAAPTPFNMDQHDEEERFALHIISTLIFIAGSRIRIAYAALPAAIMCQDPGAAKIVATRMVENPGWLRPSEVFSNRFYGGSSHEIIARLRPAFLAGVGTQSVLARRAVLPFGYKAKSNRKLFSVSRGFGGSPTRKLPSLYFLPMWAIFGIQYGIAIAIAVILTSIAWVRVNVFHGRTVDVAVTVAATWMPTVGDVHWRAFNRILGTTAGGIWSYLLLSLSFAINGASWRNTAGKFIAAAGLTAIWGALCAILQFRYPKFSVTWIVAAFTTPLVALPSLRALEPQWVAATWRLLNVIYGAVILWLVSFSVLPVGVRHVLAGNFTKAISNLACLSRQMSRQLESQVKNQELNEPDGSSTLMTRAVITIQALQAFFSPDNEDPVVLAINVERSLTALALQAPLLKAEKLPWIQRPRHPEISDIMQATDCARHFGHMFMFYYAMKMDNSPSIPWLMSPLHQEHIANIAELTARALETVPRLIYGDQSIEDAMDALDHLDSAVQDHIDAIFKAELRNPEHGPAISQPAQNGVLPLSVAVLIYVMIGFTQQVRLLYRAVVRAFLPHDTNAIHLADAKASSRSALGPYIWPESILALLLEGDSTAIQASFALGSDEGD